MVAGCVVPRAAPVRCTGTVEVNRRREEGGLGELHRTGWLGELHRTGWLGELHRTGGLKQDRLVQGH